jgi:hypothetical protein
MQKYRFFGAQWVSKAEYFNLQWTIIRAEVVFVSKQIKVWVC